MTSKKKDNKTNQNSFYFEDYNYHSDTQLKKKKLDIKVGDKASWRIVERTNVKNIRYYHCLDDF